MEKGRISFICDDKELEKGFAWAKKTALAYSHEGDLVGDWYEAALPKRQAFCIRDVCHHLSGAQFLGLGNHTKNMLLKFAQSVSESKDFCPFWEITKGYYPAPVDYTNDKDFWFNLPANFDIVHACKRAYMLTGDREYIDSYDFRHFYDITFKEYIERWDHDGDGIPDRAVFGSRRGIPSYDEQPGMEEAIVASDLISVMAAAYDSYGFLLEMSGREGNLYRERSDELMTLLDKEWWNEKDNCFYSAKLGDGTYVSTLGSPHLMAYYGAVKEPCKLKSLLDFVNENSLKNVIVEIMSHYPEIYYKNGQEERGLYWLKRCIDPRLKRREYPEVSFSVIGSYVQCLMGITADASTGEIDIHPKLPENVTYAELTNCPIFGGEIDCIYNKGTVRVVNRTGRIVHISGQAVPTGESVTAKG